MIDKDVHNLPNISIKKNLPNTYIWDKNYWAGHDIIKIIYIDMKLKLNSTSLTWCELVWNIDSNYM